MKKATLIALILLMAGNVFSQANLKQDKNKMNNIRPDKWVFFSPGETETADNKYFLDIQLTDTMKTAVYGVYPYIDLTCLVADTNAAHDSVNVKYEMWQNDVMDTTGAVYVKDLVWHNEDGTLTDQSAITTTGKWFCYIGETPYLDLPYMFLKQIPQTTHRVIKPGVSLLLSGFGNVYKVW